MCLAIGLAGLVQGATGFGFGIVAVALISLIADIRDASILVSIAGLSTNIALVSKLYKNFRWERVTPLIVSAVVGIPLGVYLLSSSSTRTLRLALGVWLIVTAIQSLLPATSKIKVRQPALAGVPYGLFAGILHGALGSGAPAAVPFVISQEFDRFRYAATLQVLLGVMAVLRVTTLSLSGLFTPQLVMTGLIGTVFAITGGLLGVRFLALISDEVLKRGTIIGLLILGVYYLLS